MSRRGSVGVIVLAAGESARLGQPKQLLYFEGRTLIARSVALAESLGCGSVAVVLGAFADEIRAALGATSALIVENPHWRQGMGTSLREGLRSLLKSEPELRAVVILVCDQPYIEAEALRDLLRVSETTLAGIVAAEYGGTVGVPVLFAAEFFPELLALEGAVGARQILRRHGNRVVPVPLPSAAVDIDTAADLERLAGAQ